MRRLLWLLLAGCTASEAAVSAPATAPVTTVAVAAPPPAAAADTRDPEDRRSCGDEPLTSCPLQRFMEAVLAPSMKKRDFVAVEGYLKTLATWAPPSFEVWREIALSGADAAHAGDVQGVRAACGACHDKNKARYRRELRDRPLPTGRNR